MSLLNSKFDIVSVDNPLALAALAQVLESPTGMTLGVNGTPVPGDIAPGAIVAMDASGKAKLASALNAAGDAVAAKQLVFVAIDGDKDYSGSFVKKITVLHGGFTMETDQFEDAVGGYTPGLPVTFVGGKVKLVSAVAAALQATVQVMGFVGPAGGDATKGVVQVIVPQGCGI